MAESKKIKVHSVEIKNGIEVDSNTVLTDFVLSSNDDGTEHAFQYNDSKGIMNIIEIGDGTVNISAGAARFQMILNEEMEFIYHAPNKDILMKVLLDKLSTKNSLPDQYKSRFQYKIDVYYDKVNPTTVVSTSTFVFEIDVM